MSAAQYIKELIEEKETLNPKRYTHAIRMLEDEIYRMRITDNEEKTTTTQQHSNHHHHHTLYHPPPPIVYDERPPRKKLPEEEELVEMCEKLIIPVNKYPNYNFVGKILGPKGNTLRGIQASSKTKISILGRGSMRDRDKEEELLKSKDGKYDHLKEPLHILIQVEAPKIEAHTGLATALGEMKKYMKPEHDKSPYQEEVVKMSEKVILPVKQYPKYNFVGKLLGPKGNILKNIQATSRTKITILGRGSTREKEKEEELLRGDDQKYRHLKDPLHVLILCEAPRSEAHARIATALNEINKYIEPENDCEYTARNMKEQSTAAAAAEAVHLNFRGQALQAPILRVGIPPPGSIILSRPLTLGGRGWK